MTLEGKVEDIPGPLAEAFQKVVPSTILHANELMDERRTHPEEAVRNKLRRNYYWVADFFLNVAKKGKVMDYLARGEHNLIFKNIEEATTQLIRNDNYVLRQEDIGSVTEAESTLRIDPANLKLDEHSGMYSFFTINPSKYGKLNKEQRKAAERAYGQGDDFKKNMKMLKDADIKETRFYVLNPGYVKEHAEEGSAVARACRLYFFGNGSNFDADDWDVDYPDGLLRGVPRVAEGDAEKADQFQEAYQTILANPKEAIKRMTPETAAGVSNLLTTYLKKQ